MLNHGRTIVSPEVARARDWNVAVGEKGRVEGWGWEEFGKCACSQLTRGVAVSVVPCQSPACRAASRSASCLCPWRRWARGIRCSIRRPASIDPSSLGSDGYATAPRSTPSSRRCSPCRRRGSNAASLNLPRRHSTDLCRRRRGGEKWISSLNVSMWLWDAWEACSHA